MVCSGHELKPGSSRNPMATTGKNVSVMLLLVPDHIVINVTMVINGDLGDLL